MMQWLVFVGLFFVMSKLIFNNEGIYICFLFDGVIVYFIIWVFGMFYVKVKLKDVVLCESLGCVLGQFILVLQGFDYLAVYWEMCWDNN